MWVGGLNKSLPFGQLIVVLDFDVAPVAVLHQPLECLSAFADDQAHGVDGEEEGYLGGWVGGWMDEGRGLYAAGREKGGEVGGGLCLTSWWRGGTWPDGAAGVGAAAAGATAAFFSAGGAAVLSSEAGAGAPRLREEGGGWAAEASEVGASSPTLYILGLGWVGGVTVWMLG